MLWNNYRYKIENDQVILMEYTGDETNVRIPKEIEGYPVTEIASGAFAEHGTGIEKIEVPGSVKKIDDFAFKMCMGLTELILHEGLEVIGENILYVTSVSNIHIPSTVRQIKKAYELGEIVSWDIDADNSVFQTDGYAMYHLEQGCKTLIAVQKRDERKEYRILDGTSRIGRNAFEGQMHLQKLILPESVFVVEEEAFESCQELREIVLPEGLREIQADAFRYCVRLKELRLPSNLRVLGERALTDTYGWSDRMNGISRITVGGENPFFEADENAFYKKNGDGTVTLIKYFGTGQEYVIPPKVSCIGESAFRRSNVKNLIIPESVTDIGKDAFRECKNLESVYIESDCVRLYVPKTPVYRKDEIAEPFYEKNRCGLYDYSKYDNLLDTWSQVLERCRMACFRLKYPWELSAERRIKYRELILENMTDLLADISAAEDMDCLSDLAGIGIFTDGNIDEALDVLNRCRKAKLVGYLMNYRQEHLGVSEFDFSL